MTTIAYRDGVLASDRMVSCEGRTEGFITKIYRTKSGLLGIAGRIGLQDSIIDWVNAGRNREEPPKMPSGCSFNAIFVRNGKYPVIHFDDKFETFSFEADYYAIGSGAAYAYGALAHGASAVEAVKAAIKHDQTSGGDIDCLAIKDRQCLTLAQSA